MTVASALFVALIALLLWAAIRRHWLLTFVAVVLLAGMFSENRPHVDKASNYRDAQDAVARATGRPCDYACKEIIADQARR